MRKLLETKLYSRNLIKGINTWAVSLVRYSGLENRPEKKKLMTMHKALHPRNDRDRLYLPRKGGRGLTSIEDSVDALVRRLENSIKKYK